MNDRTSLALAETLREHDRDVTRDLPAAPLIAGARRRRTRRRVTMSAAALAAAGLVFGIAVHTIPGRDASMPVPAGTGTPGHVQVRETSASPDGQATTAAWSPTVDEWVATLPVGGPFEPYTPFTVLEDRNGVPVYRDKGGEVTLGQEPFEVTRTLRAGRLGEQSPSTMLVVGKTREQMEVVWAIEQGTRDASELWRGRALLDIMGGQHAVVLIEGNTGRQATSLVIIELANGATGSYAMPVNAPKQPRLATWKNGEITVIDGQAAKGQDGASSPVRESAAYTWSEGDGWVAGAVRRWFGPARTGFAQHDLGHNIVLVGLGDEVCAHVMDGPDLDANQLTCAPAVHAEQAPTGSLVLITGGTGDGAGGSPLVLDLSSRVTRDLPVTELGTPLQWETGSTLVGTIVSGAGDEPTGFRVDLGKAGEHQRLPVPAPGP